MADVTAGLPTLPAPATRFVSRLAAAPPLPPAPPDPNMFVSRAPTGAGGMTTPTGVGVYPPAIAPAVVPTVAPVAAAAPAAVAAAPALNAPTFSYPTGAAPGALGVGLPGTTDMGAGLNLPPLPGAVPNTTTAGNVPNPGTTPGLGSVVPRGAPGVALPGGSAAMPSGFVDNGPQIIRGSQIVPGTGDAADQAFAASNGTGPGPAGGQGAGPAVAGGAAVGPYGMQDPTQGINAGFNAQNARAVTFQDRALDYIAQGTDIFDRATRARAITGILGATMGPNNQGQVEGQGIDALNSSLGGVADAGQMASANEYGVDVGAENLAAQRAQGAQQFALTPRPIGAQVTYSAGGIPTGSSTQYGLPGGTGTNGQVIPGGMIVPPGGAAPAARAGGPIEGSTTTSNGQVYRIVNGQPTLVPTPGNR